MNPITKVKLINELNAREAELGVKENASWHTEYKDSAWVYIGGFPYELTEGDVICVFSQYGEIVNINLVRDKKTGKSKGFCFVCFEDQRSTILAVDNLNGIKIKGRTIRVDHVANYKPPKDGEDIDDVTKTLREEGCAPKVPAPASPKSSDEEGTSETTAKKRKKDKKKKKKKEKEKEKEKVKRVKMEKREAEGRESRETSGISSRVQSPSATMRVKKEKEDLSYEKYSNLVREHRSEQGEVAEGSRSRERGNERSHHRSSERDGRRRDGQDDRGNSSDRPERDTRPLRNVGGEAGAEQTRQPERRSRWDRQEEASDSRGDERDKSRKHERYSHQDSSTRYRERSQDRDRSHRDKDQHPRDTDRRRN